MFLFSLNPCAPLFGIAVEGSVGAMDKASLGLSYFGKDGLKVLTGGVSTSRIPLRY